MKIAAFKDYKAIPTFEPIELPPLTILTGLNGSGKSQLLNGLHTQEILCDLFGELVPQNFPAGHPGYGSPPLSGHPQITLLRNWADTDPNFAAKCASKLGERFGNPDREMMPTYAFEHQRATRLLPFRERLAELLGGQNFNILLTPQEDPWRLGSAELLRRAGIAECSATNEEIMRLFSEASDALKTHRDRIDDPLESRFVSDLRTAQTEFEVNALDVTQEMNEALQSRISVQMFQPNIVELFSAYRDRLVANDIDEAQAKRDPTKQFLNPDQFVEKYGIPPWEIVTTLMSAMGLAFEVVPPTYDMIQSVCFRLRTADRVDELAFSDLSSGEQVLLRFAVSVMRPNPAMVGFQRPLLLLLDEMDASLHPEMVQRWLSAIERGIVGELGIRVILTTHSPTTVALSPDESIFAMVDGRPHRVSKQEAINKLTFGVPTLSIDYSGRRQVFCESDTDAAAFEKIYSAIKPRLALNKELNFIGTSIRDKGRAVTSGAGDEMHAGEAVVRKIVGDLANLGVDSVYGLIDWDAKAIPTERVRVIGEGSHYTVENILLDPLLIGMLMVLERMPHQALQIAPRALDVLDVAKLQQLADAIQNSLMLPDDDGTLIDIPYLGGASLQIRKRYATINGHTLEDKLSSTFGPLKKYTRNRGVLARRISEVVITDYPEFCPQVVANVFQQLATG